MILTGVHTNMCVLGRPFGLRQMAKNGKHVVLMRDMTDTMYNPERAPHVSHFTGTDLIVAHIEKYVCPTITSGQILGDNVEFRFAKDRRPHVVIVMAEDEYQTERTLPQFALEQLGRDFRVSYVFGSDADRNDIPGLEVLNEADVVVISVRRRTPKAEQLALVRKYIQAGKPVVGIRTACHAFCVRNQAPPAGCADWPEFDPQVFGGNYTNHYGNKLTATIRIADGAGEHALLSGIAKEPFTSNGSLYKVSPLAAGTTVLLIGSVEGQPAGTRRLDVPASRRRLVVLHLVGPRRGFRESGVSAAVAKRHPFGCRTRRFSRKKSLAPRFCRIASRPCAACCLSSCEETPETLAEWNLVALPGTNRRLSVALPAFPPFSHEGSPGRCLRCRGHNRGYADTTHGRSIGRRVGGRAAPTNAGRLEDCIRPLTSEPEA